MTMPYRPSENREATDSCRPDDSRVAVQAPEPVHSGEAGKADGTAQTVSVSGCREMRAPHPSAHAAPSPAGRVQVNGEAERLLDSILGREPRLLTILIVVWLAISGAFERIIAEIFPPAPVRVSMLRLAPPHLVAMSDTEVAQAAHLIGSSVAELLAIDWDGEL